MMRIIVGVPEKKCTLIKPIPVFGFVEKSVQLSEEEKLDFLFPEDENVFQEVETCDC